MSCFLHWLFALDSFEHCILGEKTRLSICIYMYAYCSQFPFYSTCESLVTLPQVKYLQYQYLRISSYSQCVPHLLFCKGNNKLGLYESPDPDSNYKLQLASSPSVPCGKEWQDSLKMSLTSDSLVYVLCIMASVAIPPFPCLLIALSSSIWRQRIALQWLLKIRN
jgi:hypothetical protein